MRLAVRGGYARRLTPYITTFCSGWMFAVFLQLAMKLLYSVKAPEADCRVGQGGRGGGGGWANGGTAHDRPTARTIAQFHQRAYRHLTWEITTTMGDGDEEPLPLDVHYEQALTWLRDRNKLSKQWQKGYRTVRSRVEKALSEPHCEVPAVAALLRSANVNYETCVSVLECLRAEGLDKRNMIGQYSDPHMRKWAAIVSLYERDELVLAEIAQELVHTANYEMCALTRDAQPARLTHAPSHRAAPP